MNSPSFCKNVNTTKNSGALLIKIIWNKRSYNKAEGKHNVQARFRKNTTILSSSKFAFCGIMSMSTSQCKMFFVREKWIKRESNSVTEICARESIVLKSVSEHFQFCLGCTLTQYLWRSVKCIVSENFFLKIDKRGVRI